MAFIDKSKVPTEVLEVCQKLTACRYESYIVGGAVRDLLIGQAPHDWDIATNATPKDVMQVFGSSVTIPTGLQHGTVTVRVGNEKFPVEVTTYRHEGIYTDGRHPDTVTFAKSIREDLARRDFTMNAIAYDPIFNKIVDPFLGEDDIAAGFVRAVGDPVRRFSEDGLRVMRAIRQAAQLGFEIEPATFRGISNHDSIFAFKKVSKERVRDELLKTLLTENADLAIQDLSTTGLLYETIPELCKGYGMYQNRYHNYDVFTHTCVTVVNTQNDPAKRGIWRLGAMLHDIGKPATREAKENAPGEYSFHNHENVGAEMASDVCNMLKLSGDDKETVVNMVKFHMFDFNNAWTDATVRRFVRKVGKEMLEPLYALRYGDRMGKGFPNEHPEVEINQLKTRVVEATKQDTALSLKDLKINGSDVIEILKCKPGKIVGDTLASLLEQVIEKPELNTRELLSALVTTCQPIQVSQ